MLTAFLPKFGALPHINPSTGSMTGIAEIAAGPDNPTGSNEHAEVMAPS
jgi:hypothetical protein